MLYGIRRRPERLDRHPGIRAELTALGFSWEVPKKGPRGPRKRKLFAAAASVGGAGDGDFNEAVTSSRCGVGSGDVACRQADESQQGVVKVEQRLLRSPSGGVVPAANDGGEDGGKGVGSRQKLVAKVAQEALVGVDKEGPTTAAGAASPPDDDGVGVDVTPSRPRRNSRSRVNGGANRSPATTDAESIGEDALAAGYCRPQSRERTEELLAPAAR